MIVLEVGAQIRSCNDQLLDQIMSSITPESVQTVAVIGEMVQDDAFTADLLDLYKDHMNRLAVCFATHLKRTLSEVDQKELSQLLSTLSDWYNQYATIAMNEQEMNASAKQESLMLHQMQLLQLIQHPLSAALLARMMSLYAQVQEEPEMFEPFGKQCVLLFGECLHRIDVELQQ